MVRPKASTYNLSVGAAFAKLVTKHSNDPPDPFQNVECVGAKSIFEGLSFFLPELCRDADDKYTRNRNALTMLELNKFLKRMGWVSRRIVKRIDDNSRRPWVGQFAIVWIVAPSG
jgi:hypothetical protein